VAYVRKDTTNFCLGDLKFMVVTKKKSANLPLAHTFHTPLKRLKCPPTAHIGYDIY
jgi:hypothetical protein